MSWLPVLILVVLILFLIELYFFKRIKFSLRSFFKGRNDKQYKIFRNTVLLAVNLYPFLLIIAWTYTSITGNRIPAPQNFFFDYLIVYPFWFCVLVLLQCVIYFFAADIITFMVQLVYKKNREKFRLYKSGYILAILAFFCLYVPVRIVYDYYTVSVRTITYEKRSVPGVLENFRIVFVSDLQADRYTDRERLQHFVNKINSANPDLVLFAGDFITSTPAYIQTAAEYAGRINSPYGIYSCIGDHDNWAYRDDTKRSIREISDALSKRQIKMINNGNEIIMIDSARICITFVTNTYEQTIEKSTLGKLTRINDDCDLKIFLTHQPRQFLLDEAIKKNYDLFLAGHTHGGQLTLLVPFLELSPTKIETRYQRGDFRFGNLLMVVTRGLGMSLAPIRYNSTPEVSVIELKSG